MKSNLKIMTIIIFAVGIFFAFSTLRNDNLNFNTGSCDGNIDKEKIQISAVSAKIHIEGNSGWAAFEAAGNCSGNGTQSNPYVIEDLVIDVGGSGSGILINNSNVYFRIENVTIDGNQFGVHNKTTGIELYQVENGQLIDNNLTDSWSGIKLSSSNNNNISGNSISGNSIDEWIGIELTYSNNNNIIGNTANDMEMYGIIVSFSNNNNISGNNASNNLWGISLLTTNNTVISGNTANNNNVGIYLTGFQLSENASIDNTISGNTANNNFWGISLEYCNNTIISGNTANYNIGTDSSCG
ncbi:MAG: right-handed parallel beta-helix repeat-containing protein, partial [Promethearchaeota archaeon]